MDTEKEQRREQPESERSAEKEQRELDFLMRRGEWADLKKNGKFQEMSPEGKIVVATETVETRIKHLEKMFGQVLVHSPREAGVILEGGIKPMRQLKKALGMRLVGEYTQKKEDAPDVVNFVLGIKPEKKLPTIQPNEPIVFQPSRFKKAA